MPGRNWFTGRVEILKNFGRQFRWNPKFRNWILQSFGKKSIKLHKGTLKFLAETVWYFELKINHLQYSERSTSKLLEEILQNFGKIVFGILEVFFSKSRRMLRCIKWERILQKFRNFSKGNFKNSENALEFLDGFCQGVITKSGREFFRITKSRKGLL